MKTKLKILIACIGIICMVPWACFAADSHSSEADAVVTPEVKPHDHKQDIKPAQLSSISEVEPGDMPLVYFPITSHEFEPVAEGQKASYDFVVQNKGTAELKITKVKTG